MPPKVLITRESLPTWDAPKKMIMQGLDLSFNFLGEMLDDSPLGDVLACWRAEIDREVVGYAFLLPPAEPEPEETPLLRHEDDTCGPELEIAVREGWRQNGVANELLSAALETAKAEGHRWVQAVVKRSNPLANEILNWLGRRGFRAAVLSKDVLAILSKMGSVGVLVDLGDGE